ncbi:hypothetical protein DUD43_15175 [Alcaligenes faecalis]|nr:hypothetical protein DUD43_15175 [Alcaligenes faecalis]
MEKLLFKYDFSCESDWGARRFSTQPLRVLIIGTTFLISRAPGGWCYIFVLGRGVVGVLEGERGTEV